MNKVLARITGTTADDMIFGLAGNDVLSGLGGADTLYGMDGADTFIFEPSTAFGAIDNIVDFRTSQNDKIDISDLLQGYDPLTDAITDFVQITTIGSDSILKIDADGGANNFLQVAIIQGVTGLTDETALVTSGHLIAV